MVAAIYQEIADETTPDELTSAFCDMRGTANSRRANRVFDMAATRGARCDAGA